MKLNGIEINKAHATWFTVAFIILCIYLWPHLGDTKFTRYLVHDNLNANVVWFKNIATTDSVFSLKHHTVPQSLGGLPSAIYRNEFSYLTLLYYYFESQFAYDLNAIIVHLAAFLSALFLLNGHFKNIEFRTQILLSLAFAFLPFRTSAMCSIAMQPAVIGAFMSLNHDKNKLSSYLIITVFPFLSDLYFSNIFFFAIGFVVYVVHFILTQKLNINLIYGFIILIFMTIISNYKLIDIIIFENFQSHRGITKENMEPTLNFLGFIGTSVNLALKGHYHSHNFPSFLVHVLCLSILFVNPTIVKFKVFLTMIVLLICTSTLSQLQEWTTYRKLAQILSVPQTLQLRFYVLIPIIYFLLIASLIHKSNFNRKSTKTLIEILIVLLVAFGIFPYLTSDENRTRYIENTFYYTYFDQNNNEHSSFDEYYKPSVFEKFKSMTNYTTPIRVACIGIEPAVAQFNGIYTADGYSSLIPLGYFKDWLEMIKPELDKSTYLTQRFYEFGNKCYIPSIELEENPSRNIEHLALNDSLLKKLQISYLISTVKISNLKKLNWIEMKVSGEYEYDQTLYIYKVPLSS